MASIKGKGRGKRNKPGSKAHKSALKEHKARTKIGSTVSRNKASGTTPRIERELALGLYEIEAVTRAKIQKRRRRRAKKAARKK